MSAHDFAVLLGGVRHDVAMLEEGCCQVVGPRVEIFDVCGFKRYRLLLQSYRQPTGATCM